MSLRASISLRSPQRQQDERSSFRTFDSIQLTLICANVSIPHIPRYQRRYKVYFHLFIHPSSLIRSLRSLSNFQRPLLKYTTYLIPYFPSLGIVSGNRVRETLPSLISNNRKEYLYLIVCSGGRRPRFFPSPATLLPRGKVS